MPAVPSLGAQPKGLKAIRIDLDINQTRVYSAQFIGAETALGERPPAKPLHEYIAFAHQFECTCPVSIKT